MIKTETVAQLLDPVLKEIFHAGLNGRNGMIPFVVLCNNCRYNSYTSMDCRYCAETGMMPIPFSELLPHEKHNEWRK